MIASNNNCGHFWILDHKIFFDPKKELKDKKTGERVVPVKCHMCKVNEKFTKDEWLYNLGDFNS